MHVKFNHFVISVVNDAKKRRKPEKLSNGKRFVVTQALIIVESGLSEINFCGV